MKVVVFGTGFVGSALVRELAARGHEVTAVSRHAGTAGPPGVHTAAGSVHDPAFVASVTSSAEAIISALPPTSDDGGLEAGVAALLRSAGTTGARLGVVGGSAVLPLVEGGPRQVDTPGFPAWLVPRVEAHARTLELLLAAPGDVDWFYLVPAAEFGPHQPGIRTGTYRTSTKAQVTDSAGRSVIGVEDFAAALADELAEPSARRGWLAVGY